MMIKKRFLQAGALALLFSVLPNSARAASDFDVEGTVLIPPRLLKEMGSGPAKIGIKITLGDPTDSPNLAEKAVLETVSSWPFKFRYHLNPAAYPQLEGRREANLIALVYVCFGPSLDKCEPGSEPVVRRQLRARLRPVSKGTISTLSFPAIVLNQIRKPLDSAKCDSSGGKVGGTVKPTAAFLSAWPRAKSLQLLAIPTSQGRLPAPFALGFGARPLTASDIPGMEQAGILHQHLQINGANPISFALTLPKSGLKNRYSLYANICKEGQTAENCLLGAFPLEPTFLLINQSRGLMALVPAGFELLHCGAMDQAFYLHNWINAGWPTDAGVKSANPPEIIEGAYF